MNVQHKVSELTDGARQVDIKALEVISVSDVRNVQSKDGTRWSVQDIMVQDETGSIKVPVWETENQERIKVGTKFSIENGYVTSWNGDLQLNVGRLGKLTFDDDVELDV